MPIHVKRRGLSDDELMHFKYIKKVRTKNGKWRYIYDKDELEEDFDEFGNKVADKVGLTARKAANKQHNYVMTINAAKNHEFDNLRKTQKKYGFTSSRSKEKEKVYDSLSKKYDNESKKYYDTYLTKYHKTPLGKLDKAKRTGQKFIENISGKDIWRDFEVEK